MKAKVFFAVCALFVGLPGSAFSQVQFLTIDWNRVANNWRLIAQNREANSLGAERPENWHDVARLIRTGELVYIPVRGCGYRVVSGSRLLAPDAARSFA